MATNAPSEDYDAVKEPLDFCGDVADGYFQCDILMDYDSIAGAYGEDVAERLGLHPPQDSAIIPGVNGQRYWTDYFDSDTERYTIYVSVVDPQHTSTLLPSSQHTLLAVLGWG